MCGSNGIDGTLQFNRSMRLKANKMGYSLNQRGLYGKVIRDPSDRQKKLNNGTKYPARSFALRYN